MKIITARAALEKKRVLIVDDDAELGKILEKFFVSAGVEAESAVKGKEALKVFEEMRPHLVLLDLLLPDMMGFDVLKKMKEKPYAAKTAFVMMSGILKSEKEKKRAREEGAVDFLEKPFDVRKLHNTILKELGMASVEDLKKESIQPPKNAFTPGKGQKPPAFPEPAVTIEGGDLAQADLPRLMSAFFTAKVSGVLTMSSGDVIKAIYFENGLPIFAASKDPRDRLGEIMLRSGKVNQTQIEEALIIAKEEGRLGGALIQLGIVSSSDVFESIQLQIREIIFSTFAWSNGRYAFKFDNLAGREMIKLKMSPADVVLEGIRRYYSIARLKNLLISLERVLTKSPNPLFRDQELHLGGSEKRIFDLADGKRTIHQIVGESKQVEALVLQLLYSLLAMKILVDATA